MLNDARNSIYTNPALIVYPGICLIICCAGFNLLGEGIRSYLARRTRSVFLDVRNLAILKTGEEIAKDISFSIDGGEMLSIVGSSGAGKTTVCKAVMGLLSSNYSISGEVLSYGENLLHCSKKRLQAIYGKEICYIMQNPMTAFNPSLRIGRQLEKTCYLHNPQISRQELQLLVSNTLQQLGLDDLKRILKSYPDALSGGMLRRL